MTAAEILRAARKRIERPENWTQGAYARDSAGAPLTRDGPSAVRWCASEALILAHAGLGRAEYRAYIALRKATSSYISEYNDAHTHAEVLAAFDRAIADCEAEETK